MRIFGVVRKTGALQIRGVRYHTFRAVHAWRAAQARGLDCCLTRLKWTRSRAGLLSVRVMFVAAWRRLAAPALERAQASAAPWARGGGYCLAGMAKSAVTPCVPGQRCVTVFKRV